MNIIILLVAFHYLYESYKSGIARYIESFRSKEISEFFPLRQSLIETSDIAFKINFIEQTVEKLSNKYKAQIPPLYFCYEGRGAAVMLLNKKEIIGIGLEAIIEMDTDQLHALICHEFYHLKEKHLIKSVLINSAFDLGYFFIILSLSFLNGICFTVLFSAVHFSFLRYLSFGSSEMCANRFIRQYEKEADRFAVIEAGEMEYIKLANYYMVLHYVESKMGIGEEVDQKDPEIINKAIRFTEENQNSADFDGDDTHPSWIERIDFAIPA